MLAAVRFGLRHQLILQTETRLGLAHKTPIPNLDLFLETFLSEMMEADRDDARFNHWLKQTVAEHYPGFRNGKRLDLPNGDCLIMPDVIEPIHQPSAAPIAATRAYFAHGSGVQRRDPARKRLAHHARLRRDTL